MQKPKNLLPGLFLCVFSRTAEPLVDFIAVIFGFSFFYLGQTFFAGKKGIAGPFYIGPFYTGPFCAPIPQKPHRAPTKGPPKKNREPVAPLNAHLEIPTQKARRAHHTFTARLYLACRRAQKAPIQKSRKGAVPQRPPRKNPGSNSRGLVDEKFI